jgi:hypothetical protein
VNANVAACLVGGRSGSKVRRRDGFTRGPSPCEGKCESGRYDSGNGHRPLPVAPEEGQDVAAHVGGGRPAQQIDAVCEVGGDIRVARGKDVTDPCRPLVRDDTQVPDAGDRIALGLAPQLLRRFGRGEEDVVVQLVLVLPPVDEDEVPAASVVHSEEADAVGLSVIAGSGRIDSAAASAAAASSGRTSAPL